MQLFIIILGASKADLNGLEFIQLDGWNDNWITESNDTAAAN